MQNKHKFSLRPVVLAVASVLALQAQAQEQQNKEKQLGEVEVRSGGAAVGQRPILRSEIVATESFSVRDIERSGATTLIEALDKRPGVTMQMECSICNVRNVVLNNLPGRFTTLMIDGIPIFSSVSTAYGLDSVSLGGLERIDISRGAGASLIAPEALAGAVNLVTRWPDKDQIMVNQQFGSYGHLNTDAFAAKVFDAGALTVNYNHNRHDTVDEDGNKVSEYSGYKRNLGGLGFFLNDLGGFKVKGRLDYVDEKRMGGAMGDDYDKVKGNTVGNPFNWSKGKHASPDGGGWVDPANGAILPYADGLAGMSEIIFTKRTQLLASGERKLGEGKLRLAMGYAHHDQDSFYEMDVYKAKQDQYYFEVSTQQPIGETLVTGGLSYRYEDLKSKGMGQGGTVNNDGIDNYEYRTPGLFLQAYRAFLDGQVEVNGSLRWDDSNVFGTIFSPRLNVLVNHNHELNSRFAVGRGYRAPTSFFEQDHGILNTTAIVREIDKPEISDNASYALSYAGDRLAWVGSLNWNRIKNMALLDSGATDPVTGNDITLFTSAENPVTVAGADLTVTYKITPHLEGTVAAERFHYRFDPGTLAFARPETRAYLRLDYNQGPWDLMARGTWTGSQDLARFYDYKNNPRYNFDGSRKLDKSPAFWVFDVRGEYRLNKQWALFAGVDNLLDYNQNKKESMLWVDGDGGIDVTQIWGPNRGRFVYGGVKFSM